MKNSAPIRQVALRAFTLVELMVAVGLLLVVIVATSRVFSTASRIASLGEANNDVLQEIGAIERQIRTDFSRIDYDGYLVIQCVAVANNINKLTTPTAPLLDPTRPANATVRCDQIAFFTKGTQTSARFAGNQDLGSFSGLARSTSSRVLYGHGVQLPDLIPEGAAGVSRPDPYAFDNSPLLPWSFDPALSGGLDYRYWIGNGGGRVNGTQPEARDWTLARQAVLLADDGGAKNRFHKPLDLVGFPSAPAAQFTYGNNSSVNLCTNLADESVDPGFTFVTDSYLLPSYDIINSRVDVAACSLSDLRRILAPTDSELPGGAVTIWRTRIINATFGPMWSHGQLAGYVRSEKTSPSMNRQDVMLTTPTLGTNCSSFMIDWTWEGGAGATVDPNTGEIHSGFWPSPIVPSWVTLTTQPNAAWWNAESAQDWMAQRLRPTLWFGFPDTQVANPDDWRGVTTLTKAAFPPSLPPVLPPFIDMDPIRPAFIEGATASASTTPITFPLGATGPIKLYTAVFGFNGDQATFQSFSAPGVPPAVVIRDDFTPWPTALRFTMRLHDPEKRLEQGRMLQLIVELPKRPAS